MPRDFTLETFNSLCKAIANSDFEVSRMDKYVLSDTHSNKKLIMRHDVDRKPKQALEMAKIEKENDIFSTYYFRTTHEVFNKKIIREISEMGHEIGFHYEVLAKNNGNFDKAIIDFKKELSLFRSFVEINTICMHGSPLSKWTDSDLWSKFKFSDFDIIAEAFLSLDYSKIKYFTDTGRSWNGELYNVRDKVNSNPFEMKIEATFDLIESIPKIPLDVCINSHPHRWHDSLLGWTGEFLFQNLKNIGKRYFLKN